MKNDPRTVSVLDRFFMCKGDEWERGIWGDFWIYRYSTVLERQ